MSCNEPKKMFVNILKTEHLYMDKAIAVILG